MWPTRKKENLAKKMLRGGGLKLNATRMQSTMQRAYAPLVSTTDAHALFQDSGKGVRFLDASW